MPPLCHPHDLRCGYGPVFTYNWPTQNKNTNSAHDGHPHKYSSEWLVISGHPRKYSPEWRMVNTLKSRLMSAAKYNWEEVAIE